MGNKFRIWDFVLQRDDGTMFRLHPSWGTTKIDLIEQASAFNGQAVAQAMIPASGLGMSSGPETYRYDKEFQVDKGLCFGCDKGAKGLSHPQVVRRVVIN